MVAPLREALVAAVGGNQALVGRLQLNEGLVHGTALSPEPRRVPSHVDGKLTTLPGAAPTSVLVSVRAYILADAQLALEAALPISGNVTGAGALGSPWEI